MNVFELSWRGLKELEAHFEEPLQIQDFGTRLVGRHSGRIRAARARNRYWCIFGVKAWTDYQSQRASAAAQ